MAGTSLEQKKWIEKGRRQVEEGLPTWYNTFADMMTLLLAFFVLLAAISTVDPVKLQEMADTMGKSVGKKIKKKGAMTLAEVQKEVARMVKRENLEKDVKVTTNPKGVTISISDRISFESGSAELKPDFIPVMEKIVPTIQNSHFDVQVEGHTDNVPISVRIRKKFPTNWELSTARASAVVRKFIDLGVEGRRLRAVGMSWFAPRNFPTNRIITEELIREMNDTEEKKAKNRRVEITFLASGLSAIPTSPAEPEQ